MIEQLITRLSDEVTELQGRVEGAAEWAEMVRTNALPQHGTSAYVIPLGLLGRDADASTGVFTQMIEDAFAVILIIRGHVRAGQDALDDLHGLIRRLINAVAGWAPADQVGVFRFVRGGLASSDRGTMAYQIDFSISDQLRIFP